MIQKFTSDFIRKNFTLSVVIWLGFIFGWIALMQATGLNSVLESFIQASLAALLLHATYRTYQLRRHFPAIRLLRQLGDKNSPHEPATKNVIESYLSGVPGYNSKTRPYDRIIEMTAEENPSDFGYTECNEDIRTILKKFNDREMQHLMKHFHKMHFENKKASFDERYTSRETTRRKKIAELIGVGFQNRVTQIQGTMVTLPAQADNPKKSKINDLSSFDMAISYVRGSKLPADITSRATQMRDRYQQVRDAGGFDLSVQAVAIEMLDKDLPALVRDYDKLISVAAGSQRQEGKQVFINAFTHIADRFDALMEVHSQTAVDAITTRANYIRNVHGIDKNDPFALIASDPEKDLDAYEPITFDSAQDPNETMSRFN